jgi:hypothetical protein
MILHGPRRVISLPEEIRRFLIIIPPRTMRD